MEIKAINFGSIIIDGIEYKKDIVLEKGKIFKRDKKISKKYKDEFDGHTPLTREEDIPWNCKTLVIGTGYYGALPISDDLKKEAEERGVKLKILKTPDAVDFLNKLNEDEFKEINVILHVTC
ncbi:MAG TPA: hypothetical protein HA341_04665 [Halobacteria archaeon]|jgi:hypothetical protein|nr:hypothetical protein [Halobacteria archaeon]